MSVDLLNTPRRARFKLRDAFCGIGAISRATDFSAQVAALVAANALTTIDGNTFGLVGNPNGDAECSITSGSAVLTSPNNPWTAADVGDTIYVAGAGAAGGTLQTTIAAYTGAGQVTLATIASTTVASSKTSAGGLAVWGDALTLTQTLPAYLSAAGTTQRTVSVQVADAYAVTAQGTVTARALSTRFGEIFNVKDFGAVGNGVADDTAAIQLALNAVATATRGQVYFPVGTYLVSASLTVNCSDLGIVGCNALINSTYNGALFAIAGTFGSPISRILVQGLRCVATTIGTGGQHGIKTDHCRDVLVSMCEFKDFAGAGVKFDDNCQRCVVADSRCDNIGTIALYSEGDGSSGTAGANRFIWFVRNRVENFYYGIEAKESTDVYILNNEVYTGRVASNKYAILVTRNYGSGVEITPQRIVITGNQVRGADYYGINVTQGTDFIINNNIVEGAGNNAITASGSVGTVVGNVVENSVAGISANYNSQCTGGAGGAAASYDAAYIPCSGNTVKSTTGSYSYSFNVCTKSNFSNNIAAYPSYAGYAYYFNGCDYSVIVDNSHFGGSTTYGFRYDNNNQTCTIRGNRSTGASTGEESWPSDLTGCVINGGNEYEERLARLQTTGVASSQLFTYTISGTNQVVMVDVTIACKSSSGSGYRAGFKLCACAYRAAGGAVLQGAVTTIFSQTNDAGLTATIDVSGNDVRVSVTGIAATNILWVANVNLTKRIL